MKSTYKLFLTLMLAASLCACGSDDSMDPMDMDAGTDSGEDAGEDADPDADEDTGPVVIPEPSNGWESIGTSARIDGITKNETRSAFRPVWVESDEGLSIFYESQQQIHARSFDGEEWVADYASGDEGIAGLTTNGNNSVSILRSANGDIVLAALERGSRGGNQLVVMRWAGDQWRRFPEPNPGNDQWSWEVSMSVVDGKLAVAQGVNDERSRHLVHLWDGDDWEEGPELPEELYERGQPNVYATNRGFVALNRVFDQGPDRNDLSLVAYELSGTRWEQLEGEHRGGSLIEPVSQEDGWINGYRAFLAGDVLQVQVTVNDRMGLTTRWLAHDGDEWVESSLNLPTNAFVVSSIASGDDVALAVVQPTRSQGSDVRVGLVNGDEVDFVDRDSPGGGGVSNSGTRQSQTPALHLNDDYGLCVAWSEALANGQNSPQWSTSNIRVLCNETFFD